MSGSDGSTVRGRVRRCARSATRARPPTFTHRNPRGAETARASSPSCGSVSTLPNRQAIHGTVPATSTATARRRKRDEAVFGALVAVLGVLAATSAGAGSTAQVKLGACKGDQSHGRAQYRPHHIQTFCVTERQPRGTPIFYAVDHAASPISNRREAYGKGIARIYCGGPSCHSTHRRSHLHASRLRLCSDGTRIFTRLRVRYSRPVPHAAPRQLDRVCPSQGPG